MNTKLNRSDYILLAVVFGITTLFEIVDYHLDNEDFIDFLVDIPATMITAMAIIYCFMYWLIPQYLIRNRNYIIFVVLSILTLCVFGIMEHFAEYLSGGGKIINYPILKPKLYYIGVLFGSESASLPFALLLAKKFYEGQNQLIEIQKQQKENELKLLRSQLDPHFLFNNLNTLDALIDTNTIKAKEYINRLSLIYRYLIQTKDAEIMELSEEMNLAENYVFLIQTRFGTDYEFQFDIKTDYTHKFVPTGALQAVLENVVKHNKAKGTNVVKSIITVDADWISVINQKSPVATTADSLGTGLKNLTARYQLLSDATPVITESETEFKIQIPIIILSTT